MPRSIKLPTLSLFNMDLINTTQNDAVDMLLDGETAPVSHWPLK